MIEVVAKTSGGLFWSHHKLPSKACRAGEEAAFDGKMTSEISGNLQKNLALINQR